MGESIDRIARQELQAAENAADSELISDKRLLFLDTFSYILCSVPTYLDLEQLNCTARQDKINAIKRQFYRQLDMLSAASRLPRHINSEILERFYSFQELDWSKREEFARVKDYFWKIALQEEYDKQ